jgi:hypothetical protein
LLQVHEQLGVMQLHPLNVNNARRRALFEGLPQVGIFALVMCVEGDGQHREVIAHDICVRSISLRDARDQRRRLGESRTKHSVDLGHPPRIAGLAVSYWTLRCISTRGQDGGRHESLRSSAN